MALERLHGLTRKQIELVRETVLHYLHLHGGGNERGKGKFVQQRHIQCRLTQDLLAAVDSWTDPSTATAQVYEKFNSTDDMQDSGRAITVVNRSTVAYQSGAYCKAEWIDGEWQLYVPQASDSSTIRFEITEADCEGRSAIVRILSSSGSVPGSYEIYGETETNEAGEVVNSRFVVVYDKTGCYLNESNKNLFGRIGHATYLNGRPKYQYQPWTCFEIVALAEQQTECEAF